MSGLRELSTLPTPLVENRSQKVDSFPSKVDSLDSLKPQPSTLLSLVFPSKTPFRVIVVDSFFKIISSNKKEGVKGVKSVALKQLRKTIYLCLTVYPGFPAEGVV